MSIADALDRDGPNNYGFVIDNFDRGKVQAELKRRGLDPKPYSPLAWTIADPDGMQIEVAGWGVPEIWRRIQGVRDACAPPVAAFRFELEMRRPVTCKHWRGLWDDFRNWLTSPVSDVSWEFEPNLIDND